MIAQNQQTATTGDKATSGHSVRSLSVEQWYGFAKEGIDLTVRIRLQGSSMEPLIRYNRDVVTIIPLKRELKAGDVVLFRRQDGAFVVHRYFRMSSDGSEVQTWGDNCEYPDSPVKREAVLGLVVSVEKNGKTMMLDTDQQREQGIRWMNRSMKRKAWFTYRRGRAFAGRCKRWTAGSFKRFLAGK